MKRTQLYIEDDLWKVLEMRAQESGASVSELVRRALRERYFDKRFDRSAAMRAIVGIRSAVPAQQDTDAYVRELRRGTRLDRLR